LPTAGEAVAAGAVVFEAAFLLTFFFDFLAVVAVAVLSLAAGAGVAGAAVCAKEIPASASVIVIAAMVFMMFYPVPLFGFCTSSAFEFCFRSRRFVLFASAN
jgi:hypothetical protein